MAVGAAVSSTATGAGMWGVYSRLGTYLAGRARALRALRHAVGLALLLVVLGLYVAPPPALDGGALLGICFGGGIALGLLLDLRGLWLSPLLLLVGVGRLGVTMLVGPRPPDNGEAGFFALFYVVILPMTTLVGVLLGVSLGWRPSTGRAG